MLLELAIGDAYGAGFEFSDPPPNDLKTYHSHLSQRPITVGSFTFDPWVGPDAEKTIDRPALLISQLEDGDYGRGYLIALDRQLTHAKL